MNVGAGFEGYAGIEGIEDYVGFEVYEGFGGYMGLRELRGEGAPPPSKEWLGT